MDAVAIYDFRGALDMWRLEIWKQHQYNDCIMGPKTVMSDALLRRFSSRTNMQTAEDVNMAFPDWGSARKHGLDALRVLNQVDAKFKEDKDKETEEKKLKRAKLKEQRVDIHFNFGTHHSPLPVVVGEVHVEVQVDHPEPPPHSCQYPPSNYFGYPQYPRCYSPYYHPCPPYSMSNYPYSYPLPQVYFPFPSAHNPGAPHNQPYSFVYSPYYPSPHYLPLIIHLRRLILRQRILLIRHKANTNLIRIIIRQRHYHQ
ncbi:hypothetical protein C8Q75DRAFT_194164 [Abortiporus biennis]|nr:hypothetical protein C8Q75DRAFT_194164 [Abortiporus biennis]